MGCDLQSLVKMGNHVNIYLVQGVDSEVTTDNELDNADLVEILGFGGYSTIHNMLK